MSQTQTPDDFFKYLQKLEEKIARLERAQSTPQSAPMIFQGEGLAPDSRLRRTDAGVLVVEKTLDGGATWTQTWSTQATDTQSTGWQNLALRSGFSPYDNGFNPPQYYRDSTGRVHLRGLIRPAGNYTGSIIGDLPAGYRPATTEIHGPAQSATGSNAESYGRIDVRADGAILQYITSGVNGYISLDGISFMSAGGPYSGQATPNLSFTPDNVVFPATPWWNGGAYGSIVNNGQDYEFTNNAGQTSRIMLPTFPFQTSWECNMSAMITADSGNWTKIIAGIQLFAGNGVLQDHKQSYGNSNQAATSNAASHDWRMFHPRIRITLPANSVGWFFRPIGICPTQFGAIYHRDYLYSDFWARRMF